MEKVYLKSDDVRPCVECDYGFTKEILYMGFMYPFKKGDMRFFWNYVFLTVSNMYFTHHFSPNSNGTIAPSLYCNDIYD